MSDASTPVTVPAPPPADAAPHRDIWQEPMPARTTRLGLVAMIAAIGVFAVSLILAGTLWKSFLTTPYVFGTELMPM